MFCLYICGRGGALEELFYKDFCKALRAQNRTHGDSGTDHRTRGREQNFPIREAFAGHGAQNKHGDLNRTPDQSPRGRETEKQRVLGFGGFQGASVNRL